MRLPIAARVRSYAEPEAYRTREPGRYRRRWGIAESVAAALLLTLAVASAGAPWLATHDPFAVDPAQRLRGPSYEHWLGTDHLGRDTFSRLLYGGRITLGSSLAAGLAVFLLGLAIGITAGYFGGWWDAFVNRIIEILLAIPSLLVALAIAGTRPGLGYVLIAMVAVGWVSIARVVRSLALSVRAQAYVEAARVGGASHGRILVRHVLPAVLGPGLVLATLEMGHLLLAITGLSYIGLGVQPPTPEWGAMLNESRAYFFRAPRLMLLPGIAIVLATVSINLLGDRLRDLLDPRNRWLLANSTGRPAGGLWQRVRYRNFERQESYVQKGL